MPEIQTSTNTPNSSVQTHSVHFPQLGRMFVLLSILIAIAIGAGAMYIYTKLTTAEVKKTVTVTGSGSIDAKPFASNETFSLYVTKDTQAEVDAVCPQAAVAFKIELALQEDLEESNIQYTIIDDGDASAGSCTVSYTLKHPAADLTSGKMTAIDDFITGYTDPKDPDLSVDSYTTSVYFYKKNGTAMSQASKLALANAQQQANQIASENNLKVSKLVSVDTVDTTNADAYNLDPTPTPDPSMPSDSFASTDDPYTYTVSYKVQYQLQ